MRAISAAAIVLAVGISGAAHAHHGYGEFNPGYLIEVEGDVTDVRWQNPHILVTLSVPDSAGGEPKLWTLMTASVGWFHRMGVEQDVISVGDHLKVGGSPALDGSYSMYAQHFLLPSGQELTATGDSLFSAELVGDPGAWSVLDGSTANPEAGLFRVWSSTALSPLTITPPEGADLSRPVGIAPVLTEAAEAALLEHNAAAAARATGCEHKGMPRIMQQQEDMAFVQDGENILLQMEEYDTVRLIDMTPDANRESKPLTVLGYSSGVWEGDTLVVTTTNIGVPLFPHALPQSERIAVVERFTPTEDGSGLAYDQVLADTTYLTQPIRFTKVFIALDGAQIDPYNCVE